MKVAVFSDTHGNLLALEAVLADIDATGPYDEVVMAGDLAFGGPRPAECLERIRERGYRVVRGNTDEFIVEVATGRRLEPESPELSAGQRAIAEWAAEQLAPDQVLFLAELPLQVTVPDAYGFELAVVHATPWSAHPVVPPDAPADLVRELLDAAGTRVLAYGHIHLQYERWVDGRMIAAVGSVGLPFDGDQRAAYAVFTSSSDGWSVGFRRVSYDVDAAIRQSLESDNPNAQGFARTLESARPPGS